MEDLLKYMRGAARNVTRDPDVIEDCVQQSMNKLIKAGRLDCKHYAASTVVNAIRDRYRAENRLIKKHEAAHLEPNQEYDIDTDVMLNLLLQTSFNLSKEEDKSIALAIQGYTSKEAARKLNVPSGTYRRWLHNARNKVKKYYGI